MQQYGKADRQFVSAPRRFVDGKPDLFAAIDFGQQARQCLAFVEYGEHARGPLFHQAAGKFLPDAFGNQMIDLAAGDHLAHQRDGLRSDGESEKARRKSRDAQDAHRVFDEGRADMAQHARGQVGNAVKGVSQRAVVGAGDGVDRQVAARQVFFERHLARRIESEAAITVAGLAFGARERVLGVRLRVQENGEILADRLEALRQHFSRRRADDHVIAVLHRQAQQLVTYSATDGENLHGPNRAQWRAYFSASAAARHSCIAGSAHMVSSQAREAAGTSTA